MNDKKIKKCIYKNKKYKCYINGFLTIIITS